MTWKVDALTAHAAQQLAAMSVGRPAITRLRLRIRHGQPPKGWVGAPGLSGLMAASIRDRGEGSQVDLQSAEPVDPALLMAAALRMARPWAGRVGPGIALAPGLGQRAAPLAPYAFDVMLPNEPRNPHLRRHDLVVAPTDMPMEDAPYAQLVVIEPGSDRHAWQVAGASRKVLVDPTVHRPFGRRSSGVDLVGSAAIGEGELLITAEGIDMRIRGDLTSGEVHRLRAVTGLVVPHDLPEHWGAQLQACGIVLAADRESLPTDDLDWQLASVGTRVATLRDLGPQAALGEWPSVSVILLTHRADFIDHAVRQLAKLDYPRLQFVIGAHGIEIAEQRLAPLRAIADVATVQLDPALPFGSAMQHACQRGDGELIAKVDDDDYYAPSHLWDVVVARAYSGAQVVGKALDWIHVSPEDVTVFRPAYPAEQYATFVAGGTMLISRGDLAAVGGWRPVERSIDRGLIDRVQAAGGLVYRTHGLGYVYMRRSDRHTAQARNSHFLTKVARQWPGLLAHQALGTQVRDES